MLRLFLILSIICVCSCKVLGPLRIPSFQHFDFSTHPKAFGNRRAEANSLVSRCNERYRTARLSHFTWGPSSSKTFQQRYFVCDEYWSKSKGPIFLYIGNEAGVEKYIEATGIMWELAPEFGAMLVFIEHRYYGKSKPFGQKFRQHLEYLSSEEAMADYVDFLFEFQRELGAINYQLPVIGFGGSYGGMLGAWMRMKYPHALHGVIAASAPIWGFMGEVPKLNPNYFDQIKTYDASPKAGSSKHCVNNIRDTWNTILQHGTYKGFQTIKDAFNLCPTVKLTETADLWGVIYWIDHALSLLSEGSYNFPSDYMTDGVAKLPPYPMRLGCSYLKKRLKGVKLMKAMGKFAAIFYNVTKDQECFTLEREVSEEGAEISDLWNYQYCTEMIMPHGSDGIDDMMWYSPWNVEQIINYCKRSLGVETRPYWAKKQWGGKDIYAASNIVFSNGEYDPWKGGGVTYNISESVVAIVIKEGGHHADLMFSNDHDTDSIKAARQLEKEHITKWIQEVRDRNAKLKESMESPEPVSQAIF
eukprot:g2467.t1